MEDTITFPRWWVERLLASLAGDLPSGHIGDCVFLLRPMLQDALDKQKRGSMVPASTENTPHEQRSSKA